MLIDDPQFSPWRRRLAWLLAVVAILELGAALISALGSGFSFQLGPLRLSSSNFWKPLMQGLVEGGVALWLFSHNWSPPSGVGRAPVWTRRLGAAVLIVLCELPLVWPLLQPGFSRSHDTGAHATYTYLFDQALSQGQFPVRWVELTRAGQSQPLFNFYQVGLYYIVAGVHRIVPSLALSLKLTVAGFWFAGACFMFLWLERLGWWAAVMAALVFAWSPYLLLDVFVRAAYPELAALSLAPGVLWAIDRYVRSGSVAFLPVVSALSFLILICHLPTVVIISPMLGGYLFYLFFRGDATIGQIVGVGAAGLLSVTMAAFYILPALTELHMVKIGELTSGYFDYHQHFVYPSQWITYEWGYGASVAGPGDQMSFQIGIAQWCWIAAAAAITAGARVLRQDMIRVVNAADLTWWLAVVSFAMLMMTPLSVKLWEALPPLRFVQFPWRFLMVPAIACGALAALVVAHVQSTRTRALLVLCTFVLQLYVARDDLAQERRRSRLTIDIDDPGWRTSANAKTIDFVERGYDSRAVARLPGTDVGRWTLASGDGTVTPIVLKDDRVVLDVQIDRDTLLAINSPYVPGWKAWLDGREMPIAADRELGHLQIHVPPGRHRVEARFTDTPTRRYANMLSVMGLLAWIVAVVAAGWFSRSRTHDDGRGRRTGQC